MARKAKVVRENKIEIMIEKYSRQRSELISVWKDSSLSLEKRRQARQALAQLPKNSNPNRHRNRCKLTGRSRGYVGFVGLSRIKFREKALMGEFPGIRKASL
jgi:small subunit ribosomal protein S14|tara:strand:- start:43 stop:348 length:306 start_codon:yes stop_codon:yes gene_type:complete